MTDFILIDGSYFCFFRYHALLSWWKNAHKDDPLGESPIDNPIFVEKFKKIVKSKFKELPKRMGMTNPTIIIGKDCHRRDIWRYDLYDKYKSNRDNGKPFLGAPFFKLAYNELFTEYQILSHPRLEADDCIAIHAKHIADTIPNAKISIITSDMDYLQLCRENISLYDLKWKNLLESKTAFDCPKKNLFCKIVMGDKSDDITSVFKKCGIKTAEKLYNNPDAFQLRLDTEEGAKALYQRNITLVDFNEIPDIYVNEFKTVFHNT